MLLQLVLNPRGLDKTVVSKTKWKMMKACAKVWKMFKNIEKNKNTTKKLNWQEMIWK